MARIHQRYGVATTYTTTDLALIPPCAICGARARIDNGRLTIVCDRRKHERSPDPLPKAAPLAVQRSFGDDQEEKEPWWNR